MTDKQIVIEAAHEVDRGMYLASCVALWTVDGKLAKSYADFYGFQACDFVFPRRDYHRSSVSDEVTEQRVMMLLLFAETL